MPMKRLICAAATVLLAASISACSAIPAQEPTTQELTTQASVTAAYGPGIYDIEQSIDQAYLDSVGARVLTKELVIYSTYLEEFGEQGKDATIDGDQLVWVVQTFFPEFDTIRGGVFKNATTTSLYDAETGFYYGYSVNGDEVLD